jgi:glycosyltransferase involved in cell wall biosynthesis
MGRCGSRASLEAAWTIPALPALAVAGGDILHAWHYGDGAAATLVRRGRPLVLKITGCVPRDSTELRRPDRALLHRALEGASEVWVNDDWVAAAMAGWGVPLRVVPPGIDTMLFSPGGERSTRPTALAVGPLVEGRKRIPWLVSLWPQVLAVVPDAQLRLAGAASPGETATLLEQLPKEARGSVVHLGSLESGGLLEEYRRAWVFAAPAGDEAFGLAVVEALASGTPVVATATGAAPGLLAGAGDLGATHAFDDDAGAAAALAARLQQPPSDAETHSRAQAVQRHSWHARLPEVQARYAALLG